eukprot:scaffold21283_cov37-Phaeocystis_antarctica.AAC.1
MRLARAAEHSLTRINRERRVFIAATTLTAHGAASLPANRGSLLSPAPAHQASWHRPTPPPPPWQRSLGYEPCLGCWSPGP